MKRAGKKPGKSRPGRIELGKYIVADPLICHGAATFRGTRVMVWQVLDALARGESWDEIAAAWPGRVSREAIAEVIRLAGESFLDNRGRPSRSKVRRLAA